MDRESTGRTGGSIDRFIKSEMSSSKGFIASAQTTFGDGCEAIIRNLSHEYGKQIIEYLSGDTDVADDENVKLAEGKLVLTTRHCRHHFGKDVREKIGISTTKVCPVGILATGLIRKDADGVREDRGMRHTF